MSNTEHSPFFPARLIHTDNIRLSQGIERFVNLYGESVIEHQPTIRGGIDTVRGAAITQAVFSTRQLERAADIFLEHSFELPSDIIFARIRPATSEGVHSSQIRQRALTYGAFIYGRTALMYGDLLNTRGAYAPRMHKQIVDLAAGARPDSYETPRAEIASDSQRLAHSVREFGQRCLEVVGTLSSISQTERHLLHALLAIHATSPSKT